MIKDGQVEYCSVLDFERKENEDVPFFFEGYGN